MWRSSSWRDKVIARNHLDGPSPCLQRAVQSTIRESHERSDAGNDAKGKIVDLATRGMSNRMSMSRHVFPTPYKEFHHTQMDMYDMYTETVDEVRISRECPRKRW